LCAALAHAVEYSSAVDALLHSAVYDTHLKRFEDSQEPFWRNFELMSALFYGTTRSDANRVANLMRCHKTKEAVARAKYFRPIHLLMASCDKPPHFRRATRLNLDSYVELCRLSEMNMVEVADILFHMLYENREPQAVNGIMPCCTCKKG
ncbi:MAG: hypothetical protein Q8P82_01860, partial [bacterium]|nr:hypothetical protein [bacterium]